MKKLRLLLSMAALLPAAAFAQIPNAGFENWTSMASGAYSNPDGWGTLNNSTYPLGVYTATIGTPGVTGANYLKLTSKTAGPSVVNGVAVSGVLDSTTMKPKSGFAFNQQPASLNGKYQHMIFGSSQGYIKATLTAWNSTLSKRDTVAIALQNLTGMAMSWTTFTVNFNYLSSTMPDSCMIELHASGSAPTNNDYLWVDNLAFSGSVTGIDTHSDSFNSISIYPNPVKDHSLVSFQISSAQQVDLQLIDVTGRILETENLGVCTGQVQHVLPVSKLSTGIYFVKLVSAQGITVRKIIVE